jgi:hypothetical protein
VLAIKFPKKVGRKLDNANPQSGDITVTVWGYSPPRRAWYEGSDKAEAKAAMTDTPQEGYVRRLLFSCCDRDLKARRTESTFIMNGRKLSADEMLALVAYARRYGFLKDENP